MGYTVQFIGINKTVVDVYRNVALVMHAYI